MDLRSYLTLDLSRQDLLSLASLRGSSSGTVYRSLYTQPVGDFEDQMYLWEICFQIILMTVIHLTGNLSLLSQALSKLLFKDLCSLNFRDLA